MPSLQGQRRTSASGMSVLHFLRPVTKVPKSAQNPKLRKVAKMAKNFSPPDRYAVIGHPVDHSRSPLIHTLFARQTQQNLTYELIDAEPKDFETAVRGFGAAGGKGVNVTVPHKEAAFALVDDVDERERGFLVRDGHVHAFAARGPEAAHRGLEVLRLRVDELVG